MEKRKYTEKFMKILNTKQSCKLQKDPTKTIKMEIRTVVRKIKKKLSPKEYLNIYPTESSPGNFYGTAKKVLILPIRPIIPNLATASYQLAKYLAKLFSPLNKSEYTVDNNADFINNAKSKKVPTGHSFISFNMKSLFANVPLDYTINIILSRIYDDNELYTNISKKEMKEILLLCTKAAHFTFNNEIYQQRDGVAMGSPLGPVIAGIFMVELENSLNPNLMEHMSRWKRYVDDTIAVIQLSSIEHVLSILNSFYQNIEFTYELEQIW